MENGDIMKESYKKIGEELFISKYTVKRHIHNIYEKAGVSRREDFLRLIKEENHNVAIREVHSKDK